MVISEHLYGEMLKQNQFGNQTFAMLVAKIDEIPWMIADDRDDFKDAFSKLFFYSHDVYKLQHENVYVNPGSDFYKPLEELILKMHEHGLIHYLKILYLGRCKLPKFERENENQVLTMYLLSAGFYLWLFMVLVSIIAFIAEHIYRYFTRRRNSSNVIIYELHYDYEFEWC